MIVILNHLILLYKNKIYNLSIKNQYSNQNCRVLHLLTLNVGFKSSSASLEES